MGIEVGTRDSTPDSSLEEATPSILRHAQIGVLSQSLNFRQVVVLPKNCQHLNARSNQYRIVEFESPKRNATSLHWKFGVIICSFRDELRQQVQVPRHDRRLFVPRESFAMRTVENEPPPDGISGIIRLLQPWMLTIPSHL